MLARVALAIGATLLAAANAALWASVNGLVGWLFGLAALALAMSAAALWLEALRWRG